MKAATTTTRTLAANRANTSGHSLASGGACAISTQFSPNTTPEPTVSHATLVVNRCDVTSSSVASRLTNTTAVSASTTPTAAIAPGRSPRARPTPTGIAATRIAVNGDTTEIGPVPSAA